MKYISLRGLASDGDGWHLERGGPERKDIMDALRWADTAVLHSCAHDVGAYRKTDPNPVRRSGRHVRPFAEYDKYVKLPVGKLLALKKQNSKLRIVWHSCGTQTWGSIFGRPGFRV